MGIANALSQYARVRSMIILGVTSFIGLILVSCGLYLCGQTDEHTGDTEAVILSSDCEYVPQSKGAMTCKVKVKYPKPTSNKGWEYAELTSSQNVSVGSTIKIVYNPANLADVALGRFPYVTVGVLMIVFGIVMPTCAYVYYRLVHAHKGFATVAGGLGAASNLGTVIRATS